MAANQHLPTKNWPAPLPNSLPYVPPQAISHNPRSEAGGFMSPPCLGSQCCQFDLTFLYHLACSSAQSSCSCCLILLAQSPDLFFPKPPFCKLQLFLSILFLTFFKYLVLKRQTGTVNGTSISQLYLPFVLQEQYRRNRLSDYCMFYMNVMCMFCIVFNLCEI